MTARAPSDRAIILGIATTQVIGWGAIFVPFPLVLTQMEAELGWSRALINGAYTSGLLAGGLAAIPIGRHVDRHGAKALMGWGAFATALLLALMARVTEPWHYYATWIGMGLAQAACLWGPAMAVVVALARDTQRCITVITFITGLTATGFLPLADWLIGRFGWRGALEAFALLQAASGIIAFALLWHAPRPAAHAATRGTTRLWETMKTRAFVGLALCFAAQAFVATGMGAHLIPMLRERGLPEALVLLIPTLHGPTQVTARAILFFLGKRASVRVVGTISTALMPVAMLTLALAGADLALLLAFVLCWAVGDGLIVIIRATGVMEIIGRENFGAITGAMSAIAMLPRTLAPVTLALIWQTSGGYDPVPWLLLGVAMLCAGCFAMAATAPRPGAA